MTATWSSIEDLRPDQAAIDDATLAAEDIDRIWATIGDRIALMYRWMVGQPTAAATQPGAGNTPMWCDRHERDVALCAAQGLLCNGTPYRPGHDPTGEAGTRPDKAANDHRRVLKLLALRARTDRELVQILLVYPPHAIRRERQAKTAGDSWCQSCYRDDQYHEPVSYRPAKLGGQPYYAGLCKWCGGFRADHRMDPPLKLLRLRHEGRRVSVTAAEEAVAEERRAAAEAKAKSKKKRKAA